MNREKFREVWKKEEERGFQGWDFSLLTGRVEEEELPWDYKAAVLAHMSEERVMLDMGTGGGEFLRSLCPPRGKTYATEAYPPNYKLCQAVLPAYGIEVRPVSDDASLPFDDGFFDLVINRHEAYSVQELVRVLKPGGWFITQQVGGQNNRGLSRWLLGDQAMTTDSGFDLKQAVRELTLAGFTVMEQREYFPYLRFCDIGALVYFAKVIEWEFAGFSVDRCLEKLCELQKRLEQDGYVESREHRFFILACKPI
ncbi:class I SAM-dependent methyltransferase [Paenibacillus lentus]|uniref:Class I SAM-dependent methyltransferase n=1 Tax=Paenibacillus lentus TaxID=1338368 RepID=A0A3S8RPU6_9BACL|nr:class I SAM-dependent methyltransferase [Paenibacillus lentus]AZK44980.1 class I SAM-dependent methyltransferase [Paenibacillus lentus]